MVEHCHTVHHPHMQRTRQVVQTSHWTKPINTAVLSPDGYIFCIHLVGPTVSSRLTLVSILL
jgi:hypothetical protein